MEESLHQLPFLFTLGDEFDSNIKLGFVSSIVPGVSIIGGALLFHWGLAASLGIWVLSFAANLGIAMRPLLDKKLSHKTADSAQTLTDEESSLEPDPT
jgi:hypothetical protein